MTLATLSSPSIANCDRKNLARYQETTVGCLANCLTLCDGRGVAENGSSALAKLSARFSEHSVPARQKIFYAGEHIARVPILCAGWAAIVATLPNNRRQILSFLLPNDLISAALIFGSELKYGVEAITEVTYHNYDRGEFRSALSENPQLFDTVLKILNEETGNLARLAINLGRCPSEVRIAQLILHLSERLARRNMLDGDVFHFPLRQWHIAEATGLTPVHVNKVIGRFRKDGLIDLTDRSLRIKNRATLQRIAGMM